MPPSALRFAGLCMLGITPARAAFGSEPNTLDGQALFQRDINLDAPIAPLPAETFRPTPATEGDILERLKMYASSRQGHRFMSKFNTAIRTASASAKKLRILMDFSAQSGSLDSRTARVAIDSLSLNMSDFRRATEGGGKSRRGLQRQEDIKAAKEKAKEPTDGDDVHLGFDTAKGILTAVGSDEFMTRSEEYLATLRSSILTLSEEMDFAVSDLISRSKHASDTEVVRMITEAFNGFGDHYMKFARERIVGMREFANRAPYNAMDGFTQFMEALQSAETLLNSDFVTNYKMIPENLTVPLFCAAIDAPLAFVKQSRSSTATALEELSGIDMMMPELRNFYQAIDPERAPRVIYLIASWNQALNYTISQLGFQRDKVSELIPILREPLRCELPQFAAASAPKAAAPALADPRSSDSAPSAGPCWGFWPWALLTFLLASLLSQ